MRDCYEVVAKLTWSSSKSINVQDVIKKWKKMKKIEKICVFLRFFRVFWQKSDIGHLGGVGTPKTPILCQKSALRRSASIAFYRLPRPNDRILRGALGGSIFEKNRVFFIFFRFFCVFLWNFIKNLLSDRSLKHCSFYRTFIHFIHEHSIEWYIKWLCVKTRKELRDPDLGSLGLLVPGPQTQVSGTSQRLGTQSRSSDTTKDA